MLFVFKIRGTNTTKQKGIREAVLYAFYEVGIGFILIGPPTAFKTVIMVENAVWLLQTMLCINLVSSYPFLPLFWSYQLL